MTDASFPIYVGTSGWSYPSGYGKWKGIFYPQRWNGDELAYYAERFSAVEVNSSFYRIPTVDTARGWAKRTPPDFQFAVKLYRKFTHPEFYQREEGVSPEITTDDVTDMRGMLDALTEQGKLGALLVQYADHWAQHARSLAELARTLDYFREYPLAVELRHPSWSNTRTAEILAHFKAAYVRIDEPFFSNLDEPFAPSGTVQYWRFHGRNTEWWRKPGAGSRRYDYHYTAEELIDFAESIERNAAPGKLRLVFFNNHPNVKAAANAVALAARLGCPLPFRKFAHLTTSFPELRAITGVGDEQASLLDA